MINDNLTFREWLLGQIKDEEDAVARIEKDPLRCSEFGNQMALERMQEHGCNAELLKEVLREYDIRKDVKPASAEDGDIVETRSGKWIYINGKWVAFGEVIERWYSLKL